ncbi:DENN domain-containing protein 1B-like isoform X2 [Pristis pectinata]|uniref:DENN domain-containing protein 1B-like isoform X2 n=1 Tax=Pristis pectinata TaxID=685728 RepID=UPI00223DF56E|nr:DENN domain-containing protein 1B-like isoform X2 [Pristis pectinata]
MGSRIKENPERIFEWFIEALCPKSTDVDPEVLRQYPEDYNDQESLQSLPKFCFPFDVEREWESSTVQQFTFVLTDIDGYQRFGFCRLTGGSKTCICILSFLPWYEVFYKLLNNIADYLAKGQDSEMRELLKVLHAQSPPQSDSPLNLEFAQQLGVTTGQVLKNLKRDTSSGMPPLSYFIAPDSNSLPTIPESRNLTEYVVAVDVNNMLHLYASMLHERRIIITCSKLSTLTACVHGSSAMLYPMYWQHIYIPVLPPHLLDYCCAPMPYLIGIHSSLMERVRSKALEDVVILNVDTNTLESPFNDLEKLPTDVMSVLKMKLKKQSAVTGDVVARAFLRTQAAIFGSYQDALKFNPGEPVTFCEETFLNHKGSSMKNFLQHAVHLQLFKQFIDNRLEKLNEGKVLTDMFEEEVNLGGYSSGCSKTYQLWKQSVKRGGGALIHTMKTKANPAMKNMYNFAKGQAKLGLKGMKNRLKHKDLGDERGFHRGGSLRCQPVGGPIHQRRIQTECLQNRLPITQHFGQSRPRRPTRRYTSIDGPLPTETVRSTCEEDGLDSPLDTINDGLLDCSILQEEDMDLLGEIFDTLSTQTAHDKGLLYGTRSLDFFNLDSMEDIRRVRGTNPSEEDINYRSRRESEPGKPHMWGLDGSTECMMSLSASLEETSDRSSVSTSQADLGDSGSLSSHDENITSPEVQPLNLSTPSNSNLEDPGSLEDSSSISPSLKANDKCTGIHWDKGSSLIQPSRTLAENRATQLDESKPRNDILIENSGSHSLPSEVSEMKPSVEEFKNHKGQEEEVEQITSPATCAGGQSVQISKTELLPPPTAPKTSTTQLRGRLMSQAFEDREGDDHTVKEESPNSQGAGPTVQASSEEDAPGDPTGPGTSEEATTPSVQSVLSYFQARAGEQKAETTRGKVRPVSVLAIGALSRSGKIESREERGKSVPEASSLPLTDGRLTEESSSAEQREQELESVSPIENDPDAA